MAEGVRQFKLARATKPDAETGEDAPDPVLLAANLLGMFGFVTKYRLLSLMALVLTATAWAKKGATADLKNVVMALLVASMGVFTSIVQEGNAAAIAAAAKTG